MSDVGKLLKIVFEGNTWHIAVPPGCEQDASDAVDRLIARIEWLNADHKRRAKQQVTSTTAGKQRQHDIVRRAR